MFAKESHSLILENRKRTIILRLWCTLPPKLARAWFIKSKTTRRAASRRAEILLVLGHLTRKTWMGMLDLPDMLVSPRA